jgi:PHD/YefM family antitoxin component YafN of YafNO toxin-antitoxin module
MHCSAMTTVSATEALKRGNAVLLSEDDWRAIQETLHLVSIPVMRESILAGMATDVSELNSEPGW